MSSQKLSDKIGFFRVERPSEWLMDEFKRDAESLEKRIKELEQERGNALELLANIMECSTKECMCGSSLSVTCGHGGCISTADYNAFPQAEKLLEKLKLEQQAIILENMISEIGVAPMVPIDDPHCCAVTHNDVLSYMDAEAKQLRKQAEDLSGPQYFHFNDLPDKNHCGEDL